MKKEVQSEMSNEIENKLKKIVKPLVIWYHKNGRSLPWREDGTPYAIWISEIMLQQTRIEAVKKYYARFMNELPTIQDLAQIEEEKLLKLWEGLGYYNRARNLQKAAKIMVEKYYGEMPKSYEELIELPGIGEYTAGAIASIAYGEKVPAVDGNVLRVVSRVLGSRKDILLVETKKEFSSILRRIMPDEAGAFNEGLMELGELICIPNGAPLCERCPLQGFCVAREQKLTNEIPVRENKVKRKKEERTVFLLTCQDKIAVQKRVNKGLLAGMYEFPNIEGKQEEKTLIKLLEKWNLKAKKIENVGEAVHIYSHIEWQMLGYQIEVEKECEEFLWITKEELEREYALPTAFQKYKKKLFNR